MDALAATLHQLRVAFTFSTTVEALLHIRQLAWFCAFLHSDPLQEATTLLN